MSDLNNDIIKYHNGKLTPGEMHALERKALDDPFLAEALEGSSQLTPEALSEDMIALSSQLNKAVHKTPIDKAASSMWTWPLRIAAGLVILISATVVFFALRFEKGNDKIALNEEVHSPVPEVASKPSADSAAIADSKSETFLSDATEPIQNAKEKKGPVAPPDIELPKTKNTSPVIQDGAPVDAPASSPLSSADEVADENVADRAQTEEQLAAKAEPVVSPAPQAPAPAASRAKVDAKVSDEEMRKSRSQAYGAKKLADADAESEKESVGGAQNKADKTAKASPQTIKGQVFDVTGTGLPGVNVLIKGTDFGTVTDATGSYEITPTKDNTTLVYSFIGYSSHEVEAAGKKEINVSLDEDASQLSEVVVTGYGVSKVDSEITEPLELASPEGGKRAFKQYLERNLQYPERALGKKVEGKVTIQFAVESNGQLSDFRVIKGIGEGCDEEVIRLIKSGPKWNPTKRDTEKLRGTVRVKMRFQLPKKK